MASSARARLSFKEATCDAWALKHTSPADGILMNFGSMVAFFGRIIKLVLETRSWPRSHAPPHCELREHGPVARMCFLQYIHQPEWRFEFRYWTSQRVITYHHTLTSCQSFHLQTSGSPFCTASCASVFAREACCLSQNISARAIRNASRTCSVSPNAVSLLKWNEIKFPECMQSVSPKALHQPNGSRTLSVDRHPCQVWDWNWTSEHT